MAQRAGKVSERNADQETAGSLRSHGRSGRMEYGTTSMASWREKLDRLHTDEGRHLSIDIDTTKPGSEQTMQE